MKRSNNSRRRRTRGLSCRPVYKYVGDAPVLRPGDYHRSPGIMRCKVAFVPSIAAGAGGAWQEMSGSKVHISKYTSYGTLESHDLRGSSLLRHSGGTMDRARIISGIRKGFRAIAIAFVVATLIPILLALALSVPTARVLSLIVATLLLQANAAFVGVGFGLNPLFILVVMTLTELGIVLAIYEILDVFAETSERVQSFTKSTEAKMKKYPVLHRYGAATLIVLPALPVIGLYSSVVIGWLLRWNKLQSLFFVTLGWILVTGFLLLVALGFVRVVF